MINLVQMASYTTPKIEENPAREWVEYGRDNNYYQFLIDRFNGSAVNNAIITGIGEMIYGQGLDATDADKRPLDYAKMKLIFRDEDIRKVSLDLKLLGQSAFNVVWNKGKTEIKKAKHIPIQNLRPEKAVDGKIQAYYYSDDWSQFRKDKFKPIRIDAFDGKRKSSDSQIMVIHPYSPGFFYFSPVDYQGSLQWSEIDEEIGNYHLTNIQQGFAPSMMVNFNNGTPTKEEQDAIERKITQKFTSTSGKKFVLSFNDNQQQATTIDQIPISEAAEQYKFLSEECTKKILVGHRVTSPMLFGIKDKTGLGNNAEEIKVASQLFDNTVIKPKQNIILDAIDEVLAVNGIHLDVYFKTLQPIEFADDIEDLDEETKEKETGVKMSACKHDDRPFLDDAKSETLLEELKLYGEMNNEDDWDLVHEELVDTSDDTFHNFKTLEDIDTKPTQQMIDEAARGLEMRREYGRGGTEVGVARARDISNGKNLSIETIKRMYSFFSRHEKATKGGKGYKSGDEGYPSKGKIAWLLWGGDAGFKWAERKVQEIENVENSVFTKKEYFDRKPRESDANPEKRSTASIGNKKLDVGLYKVRYAYAKTTTKSAKNPSRPFCTEMMMMSDAGIEFRYEDIKKMSRDGVNGQFAPEGQSTYDLFTWKGGVYCYHGWMRRIYFRKQEGGKFLPNKGLDNDKRVGNNPYVVQKGDESVAPINTPNRGSLKNR